MLKTKETLRLVFIFGALVLSTASGFADDWEIMTVDEGPSGHYYASMALDSFNRPHIAYIVRTDEDNSDLRYAYFNGATWEIEVLDDGEEMCFYPSLAVDSENRPHIAYSHGPFDWPFWEGDLRYAYNDGTGWSIEKVSDEIYGDLSIAIDSGGKPHIAFLGGGLKHAYKDDVGQWIIESAPYDWLGAGISIALNAEDYPYICTGSHVWVGFYSDLYVDCSYYDGDGWHLTNLFYEHTEGGDLDYYLSPSIDFYNDVDYNASFSIFVEAEMGDQWWGYGLHFMDTLVDSGETGGSYLRATSLDHDSYNRPHISYFGDSSALKYTYRDGTNWQIEYVDIEGYDVGESSSIALDISDIPHIAYTVDNLGSENDSIKYAYRFDNIPPGTFDLLTPPDGSDVSDTPTLDWEDSTDADGHTITYDVWYSTDPSFDSYERIAGLSESTYTFDEGTLTPGETYYWKVLAWDSYEGTWSGPDDYWSFTVENEPPGDFDLTAPPDGAVVIEPVTLDWEDSVDPGRTSAVGAGSSRAAADTVRSKFTRSITYDAWYAADPSFDPHDEVNDLTDSTYTFPEGTLSDGTTYYWKVRAWDGRAETWSGPDPYWSFTVDNELDVPVTSFSAESARSGVELAWECADPGVGFNLYRSEKATGLRSKLGEIINAGLITGESPYSYIDAGVSDGVTYAYWLEAIDVGGSSETFGPVSCTAGTFVPSSYALYQSRPNPARGATVIAFDLPEGVDVTLTIYDLSGRKVTTLVNENLPAGAYECPVSGLAPGVYVYRLATGEFSAVKKMVVME